MQLSVYHYSFIISTCFIVHKLENDSDSIPVSFSLQLGCGHSFSHKIWKIVNFIGIVIITVIILCVNRPLL